jgi:hypothetical protein
VSFGRYGLVVAGILLASLPVVLAALGDSDPGVESAVALGALLAALNTLTAYGLVRWSAGRSTTAFMRAILGGMVARMGVLLAAVVAAVLVLGLPKVPLAVSLLAYFVSFLALELAVLPKRPLAPHAEAR